MKWKGEKNNCSKVKKDKIQGFIKINTIWVSQKLYIWRWVPNLHTYNTPINYWLKL